MTLESGQTASRLKHVPGANPPRLRLKPKAPPTGYVDGAWWPRSNDLTIELPDVLAVLSVRLGAIDQVTYNLAEWAKVPTSASIGGDIVELAGDDRQPVNTVEVLGVDRTKIVLLVVPADTDPTEAHDAMMAAAARADASTTEVLLAKTNNGSS